MDYNILIGGAAGQGMDTLATTFSKMLQKNGYHLFSVQDYMSRVRGGHNFYQIRFSEKPVKSHRDTLDGIIALNQETLDIHLERLEKKGFVLADENVSSDDDRLITLPAKKIAKDIGNEKILSSVTLGALFQLFDMKGDSLKEILGVKFDEKIVEQNLKAFEKGKEHTKSKYQTSKPKKEKNLLIQSNQAIALGALAAGLKFYSAYPMTPSTSIMSYLTKKAKKTQIIAEQAEDEIAAINMAIGASYAGARAMTSTSGGGFSLMCEALGLSGIAEIPLVIAVIQRPGPATGLPTRTEQSDLRFVIHAAQGEFGRMVIAVRNPKDAFEQTIRAFDLADKYQIPVILLGDQYLSDAVQTIKPFDMEKVNIDRHLADPKDHKEKTYQRYALTKNGISPRLIPGSTPGVTVNSDSDEHDEMGNITEDATVRKQMVDKRAKKFESLKKEIQEPECLGEKDMDILLVGWGGLYSPLNEAIDLLNKNTKKTYGALVFGDIWPLPTKTLEEKAKKAKTVINVEQNHDGQLASLIREVTGITMDASINKYDGRMLSAQEIVERVKEVTNG